MKHDLIDKVEAELAGYRGSLALGKASLLRLRPLASEARAAGVDEAKVARIEADWQALAERHKKDQLAYNVLHERFDTEFVKTGEVVVFSGT
jgi:hypothetical protein